MVAGEIGVLSSVLIFINSKQLPVALLLALVASLDAMSDTFITNKSLLKISKGYQVPVSKIIEVILLKLLP